MGANSFGIHDQIGAGGAFLDSSDPKWGLRAALRSLAARAFPSPATIAALAASPGDQTGQTTVVQADRSRWMWVAGSSLTTDIAGGSGLVVAATGGAWVRMDAHVDIKIPVTFALADAAVLYTVPTGFRLRPGTSFWEPTANWTGGSSSAIGISSSNAGASTKGDLLGGAGGDVAATLVASAVFAGTVGAKVPAAPGLVLVGGNMLRFDRVTSAFTAGTGFVHVPVTVLAN